MGFLETAVLLGEVDLGSACLTTRSSRPVPSALPCERELTEVAFWFAEVLGPSRRGRLNSKRYAAVSRAQSVALNQ
jgi:hypothetical protein